MEKALAINPDYAPAHAGLGWIAMTYGNELTQAPRHVERALQLDPADTGIIGNAAMLLFILGRMDEAIALGEYANARDPVDPVGTALFFKGEAQAALENMQQESFDVFRLIGLPMAYHALGDVRASDAALAELIEKHEPDAAYNIAHVLAYRNEANRAFEWLNRAVAYRDPSLSEIVGNPLFGNIRDDPRWLPFLESIGRSPEQLAAIKFEVTLPRQ